jgi:phospholipid/cholesterol/gamma-HCH transport system permease protein
MSYLHSIGEYFMMLKGVFARMTKRSVLKELIFKEIDELIIGSWVLSLFFPFL